MLTDFGTSKILKIKNKIKDEVPDDEEMNLEDIRKLAKFKEKKFTYLSELGIFLDFDIVSIYVSYLNDENFDFKSHDFQEAVYSFMLRII